MRAVSEAKPEDAPHPERAVDLAPLRSVDVVEIRVDAPGPPELSEVEVHRRTKEMVDAIVDDIDRAIADRSELAPRPILDAWMEGRRDLVGDSSRRVEHEVHRPEGGVERAMLAFFDPKVGHPVKAPEALRQDDLLFEGELVVEGLELEVKRDVNRPFAGVGEPPPHTPLE